MYRAGRLQPLIDVSDVTAWEITFAVVVPMTDVMLSRFYRSIWWIVTTMPALLHR